MMNFETCPLCSQNRSFSIDQLKPMILSGDDKEMQCDLCNNVDSIGIVRSFKLPDCEIIVELARHQREKRYG